MDIVEGRRLLTATITEARGKWAEVGSILVSCQTKKEAFEKLADAFGWSEIQSRAVMDQKWADLVSSEFDRRVASLAPENL